jgi:TPP-dependent pyruvate/acetoin dehydrogenase alpha subunit
VTSVLGRRAGVAPTRLADEDLDRLLLIRRFEEQLLELFAAGQVSGTTHTCLGQEYVPVALEALLDPNDYVFSNHRGHGHYLARFRDVNGLLAEILGREGAVCNGVGGSQHVLRGRFVSTGVQGESLPVAVGTALHLKRHDPAAIAVAYVGDGTWGEGGVYEALNMAKLWSVPLVVVVENNGIAQSTPTRLHMAGSVAGRTAAFGIDHLLVSSTDVNLVRRQADAPVRKVRQGAGPLVVEFETVRLGPHSKGDDTRDRDEVHSLQQHDWCGAYEKAFPEQFASAAAGQTAVLAAAVADVLARPPSSWRHL